MNARFRSRPACPACGAAPAVTLFSRRFDEPRLRAALERFYAEVGRLDSAALAGAEFVVQRCPRCTLVFQRDVPDDTLLARLYEEWIDPETTRRRHLAADPARRLEIAHDVHLALQLVAPLPPTPLALDHGCGWGEWGVMARAFGAESWGTELSATRQAHCRALGLRIAAEDELPDATFHLVNSDQVLEHVPDPRATLALLARKLHRDGILRVSVPRGQGVERALPRFDAEMGRPRLGALNAIAPLEHLNCFTHRSLISLAASVGLRAIVPPWRALTAACALPPGLKRKARALLRPFYLRSRRSTLVHFRHASA